MLWFGQGMPMHVTHLFFECDRLFPRMWRTRGCACVQYISRLEPAHTYTHPRTHKHTHAHTWEQQCSYLVE